jgi:hypothetical protein
VATNPDKKKSDKKNLPKGLEERMRAIAREVFTEMIADIQGSIDVAYVPVEGEEIPPEPQVITGHGKGRKEDREYERLTISLDKVLFGKFKKEMKSRNLSAGKLMDVILWNRYGKPKLSYYNKEQDNATVDT